MRKRDFESPASWRSRAALVVAAILLAFTLGVDPVFPWYIAVPVGGVTLAASWLLGYLACTRSRPADPDESVSADPAWASSGRRKKSRRRRRQA